MRHPSLVCCLLAVIAGPLASQSALRDINTGSGNNGSLLPMNAVVQQGICYFSGNRWDTGTELWRSDGTLAGTHLVRDLVLGATGSNPQFLVGNGTLLFFTANGGVWRSDGTEAGTFLIGTQSPSYDAPPGVAGSRVVWATQSGLNYLLWGSDGQTLPPVLLMTTPRLRGFATSGGFAWFAAGDAASGWELWRTDGTAAGTAMIDTAPGPTGIEPQQLCSDGAGGLWFSGYDSTAGRELWHSDGTAAGTARVADIQPGLLGSSPVSLCAFGNRVMFAAQGSSGVELYVSDGTAGGTAMVLDIAPGSAGSAPSHMLAVPALGRVFFSADDTTAGREPWSSDGTAAGTWRLADIEPGPAGSNSGYDIRCAWAGGQVWFGARTSALGRELYRTDGTPMGTGLVLDMAPGTTDGDPTCLGDLNGTVLFSGYSLVAGQELWQLTAPATVPAMLGDLNPAQAGDSFPTYPPPQGTRAATLDGRQHFAAYEPASGTEPWVHDGTAAGTLKVAELVPGWYGTARLLDATGTTVYYETKTSPTGGTTQLFAIPSSGAPVRIGTGSILGTAVLGDQLVFGLSGSDSEPMITDGTLAGTHRLADLRAGTASSTPLDFVTMGDRVYFTADDGIVGRELWSTDGTSAGTVLVADLVPGSTGSNPGALIAGRSRLYFAAAGSVFCCDGTAASIMPILGMSVSSRSVVLGDLLLDGDGRDLRRSDGTAAGTFVLAQSDTGLGDPITELRVARDQVFFVMMRAAQGPQLWATDGSIAGTRLVVELDPSQLAAAPPIAAAGWGHVACARTDAEHGRELWISDGTANGTVLVADVVPGSAPSNPMFALGDTTASGLFTWWPQTVATGREPWVVPLSAFGGSDFDRYGAGCPGSRGVPQIHCEGAPLLGSPRLAYVLDRAASNSFAFLVLGFGRVPGPTPCVLRTSREFQAFVWTDAGGRAEFGFPVPPSTAFLSAPLCGQFLVFDPQGAALGIASATAGIEALIGR